MLRLRNPRWQLQSLIRGDNRSNAARSQLRNWPVLRNHEARREQKKPVQVPDIKAMFLQAGVGLKSKIGDGASAWIRTADLA